MKRWISFLFICALATVPVTGCSKSSSSSEQSTGSATEAPAAPAAAASRSTGLSGAAGTQAALGDPARGQQVFIQNCSSCHGTDGAGGGIGPPLKDEKSRKNDKEAIAWIEDPKPPMPKLYPQTLNEKDVDDVAAYVGTL
ncbi:MAG: c-type cytochrome [Vulcanimicrobiaceae bacterium]